MSLDGVAFIDHTADVGIDVVAPDLGQLLHRAALGMLALLRGEDDEHASSMSTSSPMSDPTASPTTTSISIRAGGAARLIADWLGEILFLHEVRGMDYVSAELDQVGPDIVEGRVLVRAGGFAVREIKGVTYHGLDVRCGESGEWRARVIFDV